MGPAVVKVYSSYFSYCAGITKSIARSCCEDMGGCNCAFFGCPTSTKHELSLFKIPTVSDSDGEHTIDTKKLKNKARKEWLRLILQWDTRNDARREDADREEQSFICEWRFKAECVLTGKLNCCSLCLNRVQSTINLAYTAHFCS